MILRSEKIAFIIKGAFSGRRKGLKQEIGSVFPAKNENFS
jgi:hypothetical protein